MNLQIALNLLRDLPSDTIDRLEIGKPTEGDCLLAKSALVAADLLLCEIERLQLSAAADVIGVELFARMETHAECGRFDLRDPEQWRYVLRHMLKLGLDAKDAELDQHTAELF